MKLRVLYVCHNHSSVVPGGVETYAFELYQAMRESASFEPILLSRIGHPHTGHDPVHRGHLAHVASRGISRQQALLGENGCHGPITGPCPSGDQESILVVGRELGAHQVALVERRGVVALALAGAETARRRGHGRTLPAGPRTIDGCCC